MPQIALFHERIEQALDEVIAACGGRKRFALEMWPDKGQRDAHNLLDACLNPERREKFSPQQLVYIMQRGRAVGCHAVINFIAHECSYEEARPVHPQDEKARIQREFAEAVARLDEIAEEARHAGIWPLKASR